MSPRAMAAVLVFTPELQLTYYRVLLSMFIYSQYVYVTAAAEAVSCYSIAINSSGFKVQYCHVT